MKEKILAGIVRFVILITPMMIEAFFLSALFFLVLACGFLIISGPPKQPVSYEGVSPAVNYTVIPDTTAVDTWRNSVQPSTQEDWAQAQQNSWWVYQGTLN